jgi:hypothetical protein
VHEDTNPVEQDSTQETSLTRRKALGVGALAAGGAVLAGLVEASSADAATVVSGTTSLKAAAAKGTTSITVNSLLGFAPGYTIWLDTGTKAESVVVKSVTASTSKLTLKTPLQGAHSAGTRVSVIAPVLVIPGQFKSVLTKLVNDDTYSAAALASPGIILSDFPQLTTLELSALRDYAILSGADISAVNAARAASIASAAADDRGLVVGGSGVGVPVAVGLSISCCCSCCCKLGWF